MQTYIYICKHIYIYANKSFVNLVGDQSPKKKHEAVRIISLAEIISKRHVCEVRKQTNKQKKQVRLRHNLKEI